MSFGSEKLISEKELILKVLFTKNSKLNKQPEFLSLI